METKICTACGIEKPESEFYPSVKWECKPCFLARINYRNRNHKTLLLEIFGNGCIRCGYSLCEEALEFHHIDRETKKFGVCNSASRAFWKLVGEAKKCVLLCANCHREFHAGHWKLEEIKLPTYSHIDPEDYKEKKHRKLCPTCGKPISRTSSHCNRCSIRPQKISWPSTKKLIELVTNSNMTVVGKELGISPNAIKKRLLKKGYKTNWNYKTGKMSLIKIDNTPTGNRTPL